MWPIQIDNARTKWYSLHSLSVLIHLRDWMPAPLPVEVPLNDVRPMINPLYYPHAAISAATSKKLHPHHHHHHQRRAPRRSVAVSASRRQWSPILCPSPGHVRTKVQGEEVRRDHISEGQERKKTNYSKKE